MKPRSCQLTLVCPFLSVVAILPLSLINFLVKGISFAATTRMTKLRIITISLSIILGILPSFAFAGYDAHIHLGSGYHNEIPFEKDHKEKVNIIYKREIDQLNEKGTLGGFILSPTYQEGWQSKSVDQITDENATIAQIMADHLVNGKDFRLLCGVDITDRRAVEIGQRCLTVKGVSGFKLRYAKGTEFPGKFESFVRLANQVKGVLLVHFPGPSEGGNDFGIQTSGNMEVVSQIISIMDENASADLFIAHSGIDGTIGLDGLKMIGDHFKNKSKGERNIYLETSFAFKQAGITGVHDERYREIVKAWDDFDFDYVLLGSDSYNRKLEDGGISFLATLLSSDSVLIDDIPKSLISDDEKFKIVSSNFKYFLDKTTLVKVKVPDHDRIESLLRSDNMEGTNCAGAALLGLGFFKHPLFVSPSTMENQILSKCFQEVDIPETGDIAALYVGGSAIHFNLYLDSKKTFNKWDWSAPFEISNQDGSGKCVDSHGNKNPWCKYYRWSNQKSCTEATIRTLIRN